MKHDAEYARSVAEQMLARTGEALMTGDFESFAACFCFPHEIETFEGKRVLNGESDLKAVFENMRAFMELNNVTDLVRHVIASEFQREDCIATTHEARMMSRGRVVEGPYPVFGCLQLTSKGWQIQSGIYALETKAQADALMARRVKKD